jgi:hypothetical protein
MSNVIPIAQAVFVNGQTQLVNQAVSGSTVTVALNRCTGASALQWPNAATVAQIDLSVSFDGGATFQYGGGFTAQGGIVLDIDGITQIGQTVASYQYFESGMPPVPRLITNLIVTMTVTSGPLATSGSVTVQ